MQSEKVVTIEDPADVSAPEEGGVKEEVEEGVKEAKKEEKQDKFLQHIEAKEHKPAPAPAADHPRWKQIMAKVPQIMATIKTETERSILSEARYAVKVDGWKRMEEAVEKHSCIGFVWFRSKVPSVWCHNQRTRLEKMVDDVLPGANWHLIANGDGTADFVLLLPPPPNDEHRCFLHVTTNQWGAWVWDGSQERRRPVPVVAS
jgi:hypothetical protein